ncbi:MAG: type II CAAX endopeptidase family protein [Nitrospirota bacterium]|nr:type II CAAX endopeptidase family protein [Nitrospirota bacterium]
MANSTKMVVDMSVVFAISGLLFLLEDFANAREWISIGAEARGATAVVGGSIVAVGVVFARGGSLLDLGFRRPEHWARVPFQVIGILAAFIAVQTLAPLLISSFITVPEPDMSRYASIAGNLGNAITMAIVLPLAAAIPEEIIYRGFLMGRLSEIFGNNLRGASMTVLVQGLIFSSVHFQWGLGGMMLTFIMGIVWGAAYLMSGRNLWIVILAHSAGHILLVVQLYLAKPLAI